MPPSTNSSIPVMKLLSSEARNTAAFATSSGVPIRPSGTEAMTFAFISSICSRVPPGLVEARRFGRTGADGVHADLAMPQVGGPAAGERPHGGLAGAVDAARFHPLDRGDRGIQDDRPAGRKERQRLLHGEEQPLDVDGEELVEVFLADRPERANARKPALANRTSRRLCWRFTVAKSRSRSARFETSPGTPVTCLPICLTASSSSAWRRPVMKTWAPSATNRRAVARPMPLLAPVMTATLPSSFFDMELLRCP